MTDDRREKERKKREQKEKERREKEIRLNEAARLWKTTPLEGNDAKIESLRNEVLNLSFELFDAKTEAELSRAQYDPMAFMDAFEETCQKYEPSKGAFANYLSKLLKGRKTDHYRYDKRHAPDGDSLDAPISALEDNTLTLGDVTPSAADDPEKMVMFESHYVELTALVLNFFQNHTGQQANETRRRWYRIFFTEDMTLTYKTYLYRFSHERDIFKAMLLPYLDFYMSCRCRTGAEISFTPLKPYGEVVPGREGKRAETKVPLPADVSLAYLALCENISVTEEARSNQIKFYRGEVERIRK